MGRFINADALVSTGQGILGNNMFAYCNNNPVMYNDPCGTCIHNWFLLGLVDCKECKKKEAEQTVKYNVPLYSQGDLSLCWAFCEVMIDAYQSGNILSQDEAEVAAIELAQRYHGSEDKKVWNNGGLPTDMGGIMAVPDIEALYDILVEYGPVYAYYSNGKDAHLVVVTGVNLYRNQVYTNNPWGVSGTQSFKNFKKGFAIKWWQDNGDMKFVCVAPSIE